MVFLAFLPSTSLGSRLPNFKFDAGLWGGWENLCVESVALYFIVVEGRTGKR